MYILETPHTFQVAFRSLIDNICDMLRRALLCLTAFLASYGLFSFDESATHIGVQAQYLLGLGKLNVDL